MVRKANSRGGEVTKRAGRAALLCVSRQSCAAASSNGSMQQADFRGYLFLLRGESIVVYVDLRGTKHQKTRLHISASAFDKGLDSQIGLFRNFREFHPKAGRQGHLSALSLAVCPGDDSFRIE